MVRDESGISCCFCCLLVHRLEAFHCSNNKRHIIQRMFLTVCPPCTGHSIQWVENVGRHLGAWRPKTSFPKTGFRPPCSQMSTDLDKIWQRSRSVVAWNTLQFDPDQCMGDSRPNKDDFVFYVITKLHHNSSYKYNGSPQYLWQYHKCVSSRLKCCQEIFGKFPTRVAPQPKMAFSPLSYAKPTGKSFTPNQ